MLDSDVVLFMLLLCYSCNHDNRYRLRYYTLYNSKFVGYGCMRICRDPGADAGRFRRVGRERGLEAAFQVGRIPAPQQVLLGSAFSLTTSELCASSKHIT